jgi:hypothetical protein
VWRRWRGWPAHTRCARPVEEAEGDTTDNLTIEEGKRKRKKERERKRERKKERKKKKRERESEGRQAVCMSGGV